MKPFTDEEIEEIEEKYHASVEKNVFANFDIGEKQIRVFEPTSDVNKYCVIEGNDISDSEDILLSKDYASKNDILFLKEVFRPDKRIKKISSVDEVKLKKCLEKYVISITYRGPHSVQFEIWDGETKQIITFYTRLKDAFTELSKITDCFYLINTRFIANYKFVDKEKIIKREIVVNGTSHRVNKNYVQNVELIKRRSI